MRFIIGRTSDVADAVAPVLGAVKVPYVYIDKRAVDNPAKLVSGRSSPATWYGYGRNHRVVDGYIARDMDGIRWEIEVASLEELLLLVEREGKIIVMPHGQKFAGIPEIEIYDTYRE